MHSLLAEANLAIQSIFAYILMCIYPIFVYIRREASPGSIEYQTMHYFIRMYLDINRGARGVRKWNFGH